MKCAIPECSSDVKAASFCNAHYKKHLKYGDARFGYEKAPNGAGTTNADGYRTIAKQYEHVLVAEKALGHSLPVGARVHHVNEDRQNNAGENLVVCPSEAYHRLLHVRMRALEACGNVDWRKCNYCKQWDSPSSLQILTNGAVYHSVCVNDYKRQRRAA